MSVDEERATLPAHEVMDGDAVPQPNESIVERLRKQRRDISEHRFIDIDIPGYNGDLFARYTLLDGQRLNAIREKVVKTIKDRTERGIAAAMDTLVSACDEFWVRDSGREIPLRQIIERDSPVRYDSDLAEFLDFAQDLSDKSGARDVVRGVFVNNEVAIAGHNLRLSRWMLDNGSEVDEELMGEL